MEIVVKDLYKKYGDTVALKNISFTIQGNSVVGLLGLNGAGKSTIMNIITGGLFYDEGTVSINGKDLSENVLEVKKLIGYLPEKPPLYTDMVVEDYLSYVFQLKKLSLTRKEEINRVCNLARISHIQKRLIKNLSKGYRQRVGIAQALIGNSPLLIFDEPTVGLDPTQIIEMRNLISSLGKDHIVFLSSHILSEIQAVCHRVLVINQGKIVADESISFLEEENQKQNIYNVSIEGKVSAVLEVLRSCEGIEDVKLLNEEITGKEHDYQIQGKKGSNIRRNLFFALAAAKFPLLDINEKKSTLENTFVHLVSGGLEGAKQC